MNTPFPVSAMDVQGATALPAARDLAALAQRARAARAAQPADEYAQRRRLVEEQRGAFLEATLAPDTLDRIVRLVARAAAAGDMVADVFRFPSEYCTDGGRAVNNEEADWPATLQGLALAHFDLLDREFLPLGYHIGAQVVTWPMLMPGDVSLFLAWRD